MLATFSYDLPLNVVGQIARLGRRHFAPKCDPGDQCADQTLGCFARRDGPAARRWMWSVDGGSGSARGIDGLSVPTRSGRPQVFTGDSRPSEGDGVPAAQRAGCAAIAVAAARSAGIAAAHRPRAANPTRVGTVAHGHPPSDPPTHSGRTGCSTAGQSRRITLIHAHCYRRIIGGRARYFCRPVSHQGFLEPVAWEAGTGCSQGACFR